MAERIYNVLFLCTANSARSILAECILNHLGTGRFRAFSAGSHPTGKVNPFALETLAAARIPADGVRSKSWDELGAPNAPRMDFIVTVCDDAAGELCPIWPGQPLTAHWGVPDPAKVRGGEAEIRRAFLTAYKLLRRRIELFTSLQMEKLDQLALQAGIDRIGKSA